MNNVVNVLPMGITEDQSFKASSASSGHFFPVWFTAGCLWTSLFVHRLEEHQIVVDSAKRREGL